MKIYIILIILALSLTFISGYFLFSELEQPESITLNETSTKAIQSEFVDKAAPIVEINLTSLLAPTGFEELLDPQQALPHTFAYPITEIQALHQYAKSCQLPDGFSPTHPHLKKALTWQKFNCGQLDKLPNDFLYAAPYMNPWGKSYALLLWENKNLPANINTVLPYFHVTELKQLQKEGVILDSARKILAQLSQTALSQFLKQAETIIGKDHILFRYDLSDQSNIDLVEATAYQTYSRLDWDKFLKKSHDTVITIPYMTNSSCDYLEGNLCWSRNINELYQFFSRYIIVFFFVSIGIVLIIIWILLLKIRADRKEEERKRFALQTLTHELRTPIASMVLSLESLKSDFDNLSEEGQDTFMRIGSDISRLKRLTEASKQYLNAQMGKNLLLMQKKTIPSIKEYLESVLDPFLGQIQIKNSSEDYAVNLDPYWMGLCTKNLVENALKHGKKPIWIEYNRNNSLFYLSVFDSGNCPIKDLKNLRQPFVKGQESQGLGLGLYMVHKVVNDMGGKLLFSSAPTCFTIQLKGCL